MNKIILLIFILFPCYAGKDIYPDPPEHDCESGRKRTESNEDRIVTQRILQDFFQDDPVLGSLIVPYLESRFKHDRRSKHTCDQANRIKNLIPRNGDLDRDDEDYIQKLMNNVLKEALINKQRELQFLNENKNIPWSSRRVAMCSAGTAICTAIITAGVTMAIALSEC